jgi:hypothetical protein
MKAQMKKNEKEKQVKTVSKYKADKLKGMYGKHPIPMVVVSYFIAITTKWRTDSFNEIYDDSEYREVFFFLSSAEKRAYYCVKYIYDSAFEMGYVYGSDVEDIHMNRAVIRKICREELNVDKFLSEMNEDELSLVAHYFSRMLGYYYAQKDGARKQESNTDLNN